MLCLNFKIELITCFYIMREIFSDHQHICLNFQFKHLHFPTYELDLGYLFKVFIL